MAYRAIIICIAVCLAQIINGKYINVATPNVLTGNSGHFSNVASSNLLANSGQLNTVANSGVTAGRPGILTVTSSSPIAPVGLSVYAENIVLEGPLAVSGQVPFLGTVGFEGSLDTAGQGVATCGCGDGSVGIVSEGLTERT